MTPSRPQAQNSRIDRVAVDKLLLAQRKQDDSGIGLEGVLLCVSRTVVHEPTLASRIDRVAVDKLLRAQRRPVAGGYEPGVFEGNPWS